MNLKGIIEKVSKAKDKQQITISTETGTANIIVKEEIPYLRKGIRVFFSNLSVQKGLLKTIYEVSDDTLFSIYPKFIVYNDEIKLAKSCEYAPILFEMVSMLPEDNDSEKKFIEAARGLSNSEPFKTISERFSKDIKGKFSFKPYEFSTDYGFFIRNSLYLGKLPVVFLGNELKGEIQSIMAGVDKFVVINPDTSTMDEIKFENNKKKNIIEARNRFLYTFKNFELEAFHKKECAPDCPAFAICESLRDSEDSDFLSIYGIFSKGVQEERKSILKSLTGNISKKSELLLHAAQVEDFKVVGHIRDNEIKIDRNSNVIVIEKPPLDRRTFGVVESVDFDNVNIFVEWPTVNPESLIKFEWNKYIYPGLFRFITSKGKIKGFFDGKGLPEADFNIGNYVENDEAQNRAVSLILSEPVLAFIKGEFGTGKKYLVKKALEEIKRKNMSSLVVTDSRYEEFKSIFKDFSKVSFITDDSVYLNENDFDYIFLFLVGNINEFEFKSYAGITRNLIVLSNESVKFLDKLDEKRVITLNNEHRFGEKINHFLSSMLNYSLTSVEEPLIQVINKDNIDVEFISVINPEKIVQFIETKSPDFGYKNKWNEDEARISVEIVKQFIKAGIERRSIGIAVPYERQEKLLRKFLKEEKIEDISVNVAINSPEKDIVLVNFVDDENLQSSFKDQQILKLALSRAKAKLIIIGNRKLVKNTPILGKLLLKS